MFSNSYEKHIETFFELLKVARQAKVNLHTLTAFQYASPSSWNNVQKHLELSEPITMGKFKSILKDRENGSVGQCDCS